MSETDDHADEIRGRLAATAHDLTPKPDLSEAEMAWFDYRAAYSVTAAAAVEARKAFIAGWEAAIREDPNIDGPLR